MVLKAVLTVPLFAAVYTYHFYKHICAFVTSSGQLTILFKNHQVGNAFQFQYEVCGNI